MSKWPVRHGQLSEGHWVKHMSEFDFFVQFFQPFLILCLFANLWGSVVHSYQFILFKIPPMQLWSPRSLTIYRVNFHWAKFRRFKMPSKDFIMSRRYILSLCVHGKIQFEILEFHATFCWLFYIEPMAIAGG